MVTYEERPQWEIVNSQILGAAYRMMIFFSRWRKDCKVLSRPTKNSNFAEWVRYTEETYLKVHAHLKDYLSKDKTGAKLKVYGKLLEMDNLFIKNLDNLNYNNLIIYTLLLDDFIFEMGWSKTQVPPYERKMVYE